ncbi:MAG: tRNA (adenosine(37)-N6)-dimethylallyltransferase MiaA [Firmicutes bacterium]|nr:tRNA (adenosine(37)-N6)-dimethylallyltransferase MiaA [Bacillota bacterium]
MHSRLICLAGPTASGKTALAVSLAEALDGEVVSCDSMQVYRRMDIGTAKPRREEMRAVAHYMLDVAEPDEDFSVSRYCAMATPIVEDILARGKTAIVAGGTGLYMDNLIRGTDFAPIPDTGVRAELEAEANRRGMEAMREQLRAVDPAAAARLPAADRKRILRALEIYRETGETITDHDARTRALPPRFAPVWLGLDFTDRAVLYRRIDLRVEQMLEMGLLEEIRGLLNSGVPERCTAMQAIGYKEFVAVIKGEEPLREATSQVQRASRRYAKRQRTWFRRNAAMHWLLREESTTDEEILARALQHLRDFDA